MARTQEIAPISAYAIATMDPARLQELVEDNLGDLDFEVWNLPSVTVPTGGATFWTYGDEPRKVITGIIVHQRPVRRYFVVGFDEGGEKGPPDCSSMDCVLGVGNPGGECKLCPLAEWGSATKPGRPERRGQACKKYRMLVLQPRDRITQVVVHVPPTSLGKINEFLIDLTGKGKAYHRVEVELALEAQERGGFATAIVIPRVIQDVPDDFHAGQIKPLVERYRAMLSS